MAKARAAAPSRKICSRRAYTCGVSIVSRELAENFTTSLSGSEKYVLTNIAPVKILGKNHLTIVVSKYSLENYLHLFPFFNFKCFFPLAFDFPPTDDPFSDDSAILKTDTESRPLSSTPVSMTW